MNKCSTCFSDDSNSLLFSCARVSCTQGAVCQMQNRVPHCVCPFVCPQKDMDDPPQSVCGSDEQTYGSPCQLQSFACRMQQNISAEFLGHCSSELMLLLSSLCILSTYQCGPRWPS